MHATTPVNVKQLKREPMNHPDKHFVDYSCNGLQYGFDTMVKYDNIKTMECRNNLSARSQKFTVSDLINKELCNGSFYGPFEKLPFDDYRVNPLGVTKDGKIPPPRSTCREAATQLPECLRSNVVLNETVKQLWTHDIANTT
ncbi:Hypothetical predicted protein [Mytilus galloprovincialis]|uniref:Uncharacterized protein n=1 Tax=Mytilus galloprovincialis TaxID=29158 RepID=A0A8B6GU27_MYTGA|nr:Hypothetical predicted protein [Mytilus galloprovincialis]